ncbi:MAG TPA: LolA-related protein [Steroidobacteraceae bacterium]|nr:LolA-related protein [Steroidobacteraceae bacterium]
MSSVRRMAPILAAGAAGALAVVASAADPPDIGVLLQHLARAAPATTPFVEVHFSPLLSRPLIVSGELTYSGPDALGRTVDKPYSEHTEIKGDQVSVVRGNGKPRTFSLQRAPELKTLLSSFTALLGGNREQLEQDFTLSVSGDDAHWGLGLTPRDKRISERVTRITVTGEGGSPRCMTTDAPDGSVTVMLMEAAAQSDLPRDIDRAALAKVCR